MLGKQAKVLGPREVRRLLDHVSHSRHPERDRVMVLLSFKSGLRAKEIAGLTWSMITDASGALADTIALPNKASKGRNGGRHIPLHDELREALTVLMVARGDNVRANLPVIYSERRAAGYTANGIAVWFYERFRQTGIEGASSHSGRRTFITSLAKRIVEAGGSLRDVQQLAGHSSLSTTQSYIEGDAAAKRTS
jgi:integrase